jgi:hypothetical protein
MPNCEKVFFAKIGYRPWDFNNVIELLLGRASIAGTAQALLCCCYMQVMSGCSMICLHPLVFEQWVGCMKWWSFLIYQFGEYFFIPLANPPSSKSGDLE